MFRLRQGIRGSLWFVPLLGGMAGVVVAQLAIRADSLLTLPMTWQYPAGAAQGILTTIVGAMVSLLGLVVAIGVLVVQIATGTLSPRFMRLWYWDRLQKFVLATFVGTITLAFSVLRQVSAEQVPTLGVTDCGRAWRPGQPGAAAALPEPLRALPAPGRDGRGSGPARAA